MSLTYGIPSQSVLIGTPVDSRNPAKSVTPVTLTTSYTDTVGLTDVGGFAELTLFVKYTPASNGGVLDIEISGSPQPYDPTTTVTEYYQHTSTAISSGVATLSASTYQFTGATAATPYLLRILVPVQEKGFRIRLKETAASAGTASVIGLLGGNGS